MSSLWKHIHETLSPPTSTKHNEHRPIQLKLNFERQALAGHSVCIQGDIFRGAVPQVDDYVRVWRYLVNGSSLRSTEQLTFTESFLNCSRSEAESVKRRAASQILQVMQENVRRRKLDCLLRFSSATFLLDDNGEHSFLSVSRRIFSCM